MEAELVSKLADIKGRQSIVWGNIIGLFCVFVFVFLQYIGHGSFAIIPCLLIGVLFQYFGQGVGTRFRLLAIFYTFLCFLSLIFISSYIRIGFREIAIIICCFAINYMYSTVDHHSENKRLLWEARAKNIDETVYLLPKMQFIFSMIFGLFAVAVFVIFLNSQTIYNLNMPYEEVSEEQIRTDGLNKGKAAAVTNDSIEACKQYGSYRLKSCGANPICIKENQYVVEGCIDSVSNPENQSTTE